MSRLTAVVSTTGFVMLPALLSGVAVGGQGPFAARGAIPRQVAVLAKAAGLVKAPGRARVRESFRNDESPMLRELAPTFPGGRPSRREMRRHPSPSYGGVRGSNASRAREHTNRYNAPPVLGMPLPERSFDGLPNVDRVLPPDPNGAVGPHHFVQWVNTSFAIYDKAGTLLYGPAPGNTIWFGFGGPCEFTNYGDPIVLYDHLADRWIMSQLALPDYPFGPSYQCLAVSQTPDPTGAYHRYAFVVNDTKLNDYPKLGVWPDAYYLTVNQFDPLTSAFAGQGVAAIERAKVLGGLPASIVYFDLADVDPNLGGMLPADVDGAAPPVGSPGYFVQVDDAASGATPQDQLQLWRFHVDWTDPETSTFTGPVLLATAPFDSNMCNYARNCIPQPGTRRKLDAISDRLMYRLQYRNFGTHESLVANHTVDVGGDHAGIRWYEVRDPGGVPFIHQQGTYAPDADHRWMASAAMDGAGNLAIGFSVASPRTFPSIRYAGRLASDPPGVLAQGEATLVAGSGSQTDASGRWGDYSALTVDPTDQCTFWYTQEYYATTSALGWRTRIGAFRFPSCAADLPVVTVVATDATVGEGGGGTGIFTVTRTGSADSALTVTYTVGGSATPGADYVPLSGNVTIPSGAATATIEVRPIDDTSIEEDETVVVSLQTDDGRTVGAPSSAIIIVVSDDLPSDLVIAALSAPSTGGAGATLAVSDTTKNQGEADATPSTTAFYLSIDGVLGAGDALLGARTVPVLGAGAASSAETAVTIPADTATGLYYLIAQADAGGIVGETNETNNTRVRSLQIGADLAIASLSAPPAAAAGEPIAVSDTTKNQGGGSAEASTTSFYLSTNSTLDGADVLLASRGVSALAAGAASSATTAVTIPPGTPVGTYYVIARADAGAAVVETSETNNTSARSVQIGADLTISALSAPAGAGAGSTITVGDTTKNQGAGNAGASTTAFYLSSDGALDGGDFLLGSRAVASIGTGATNSGSATVTIPTGTATGTYFIIAVADSGNLVVETNENNNTSTRSLQIGPDLVISGLATPSAAGAGGAITVSDTTKNQGGGTAAASTTAFFFSTDGTLDVNDVPLGSRAVPLLAAGATTSGVTAVTIPPGTVTGTYYIIARVDAGDVVDETRETNNTSARLILVGPDLAISALSAPSTATAGKTISVSDTTTNQGGGMADASRTVLYLSTDGVLDASDVALASRPVPALAPGATDVASTAVTIPPGTNPGTYYIFAQADGADTLTETKESNNTRSQSIQVASGG